MKIRCDVCEKGEASAFCTADEAALCDACDLRIHHANKLASKHTRFSLLYPSAKQAPLCDICQEKRAFLFCQQDRAVLCRDCDGPIHGANDYTKKHHRFLLTGVKLSATSSPYTPPPCSSLSSSTSCDLTVPESNPQNLIKKPVTNEPSLAEISKYKATPAMISKGSESVLVNGGGGDSSTSTISEYIEMLPGWHVEDFLDSYPTPFGFCKNDDGVMPFLDGDGGLGNGSDNHTVSFPSENLGIWVPQAPTPFYTDQYQSSSQIGQFGLKEVTNCHTSAQNMNSGNDQGFPDDTFTVPEISPHSTGSNRLRSFW